MKLLDFTKTFPTEESCKAKFRELREKQGIVCPKCGCKHHYWKAGKEMFQCAKCGHRTGLKAGTVMHNSKLSYTEWLMVIHLLTVTKHTISAAELQRQLGRRRYQPVWEMLHKLRTVMGKRDGMYTLCGTIELDEGFFTTEIEDEKKDEKLKRGVGSQRKSKVMVMAETKDPVLPPKKGQKPTQVSYIKMAVIENLGADTIDEVAGVSIESESTIKSDATHSHTNFKKNLKEHKAQVIAPKDIEKVLPWVHVTISNAKSLLLDTYHGVKKEFLQAYLNEFCYKFNRRYFGEALFDRLLDISVMYRSDFEHRTYRQAA